MYVYIGNFIQMACLRGHGADHHAEEEGLEEGGGVDLIY